MLFIFVFIESLKSNNIVVPDVASDVVVAAVDDAVVAVDVTDVVSVAMVLAFADGEEDGDFEAAEKRLRSIGLHLVQTANDTQADATIKSRARQLLQYVSGYCQSHGRDELHADFVAYIARCAEG